MAAARVLTALCWAALLPAGAAAQEPPTADPPLPAADTLRPDTVRADTLPPPRLPGLDRRPPGEARPAPAFPAPLVSPAPSYAVRTCDRACLLDAPWLTLAEVVEALAPGVAMVRGGWFGGPHYATRGLAGPAGVRLVVDGREVPPIESAQADLARIPLVHLERVRVVRAAAGLRVEVATRRHELPVAYSRIDAASAQPSGEILRGIFTNRWGRDLRAGVAFDLLDVVDGLGSTDRFDFWGRLGWVPTAAAGLELEYRSGSLSRAAADTVETDLRELLLRARVEVGPAVRLEALAGRTALEVDGEEVAEVREIGVALGARLGEAELSGGGRLYDGPGSPNTVLELAAAAPVAGPLRLHGRGELSAWPSFVAGEGTLGATLATPVLPLLLHLEGAAGRRGVPRPAEDAADSASFAAVTGGVDVTLGAHTLWGRLARERTERRLPFGAAFDAALPPGPEAEITAWEVGAAGPAFPVSALVPGLAPIRAEAWWREQRPVDGSSPLYVPPRLAALRLLWVDRFFEENLELRLAARLAYATSTRSAASGSPEPVLLPVRSWWDLDVQFRIADFRFFWKVLNPAGLRVEEVADVPLPRQTNVFGIRWEFFN